MGKKLLILALVVVMMFGVFGLTACVPYSLADYKLKKSNELQSYAEAKGEENYTGQNWAILQRRLEDGKTAIEIAIDYSAIDNALAAAKDRIDEAVRIDDFSVTICLEKTTFMQGEEFTADIYLINHSNYDRIGVSYPSELFYYEIYGWKGYKFTQGNHVPEFNTFEKNSFYKYTTQPFKVVSYGQYLQPPGEYKLEAWFVFHLNWEEEDQQVILVSNTVILTVIEKINTEE